MVFLWFSHGFPPETKGLWRSGNAERTDPEAAMCWSSSQRSCRLVLRRWHAMDAMGAMGGWEIYGEEYMGYVYIYVYIYTYVCVWYIYIYI